MTLHYLTISPQPEDIAGLLGMDETLLAALDRWRQAQSPVPELKPALCHLITRGLQAEGVPLENTREAAEMLAMVSALRRAQTQL